MQTETFKVTGMTCNDCVSNVEHVLKIIDGVHDVEASLQENAGFPPTVKMEKQYGDSRLVYHGHDVRALCNDLE